MQLLVEASEGKHEKPVRGQSQRLVATLAARNALGVAAGEPSLTMREIEVLRSLSTGGTDRAMGEQLGVSERTIQYHLSNIYKKLGVKRRSEAIAWVLKAGFSDG